MAFIPAFMSRDRVAQARPKSAAQTDDGRSDVDEFDRNLPAWTHYLPSEVHGQTVARRAVERPRWRDDRGLLILLR